MVTLNLPEDKDIGTLRAELNALGADDVDIQREGNFRQVHIVSEPAIVARALDHLRNSDAASNDLIAARDELLTRLQLAPLTYRLRSWQFTSEEQDKSFWSYTGPYAKDARLVTFGGHEFRVFDVLEEATNTRPGALLVVRK